MVSSRLRLLHFSICLRFAATPSLEINCIIIYANTFPKTKATCSQSRNVRSTAKRARGIPCRRKKNISIYTSYKILHIYIKRKKKKKQLIQENIDWYTEHNCRMNKSHKETGSNQNELDQTTRFLKLSLTILRKLHTFLTPWHVRTIDK